MVAFESPGFVLIELLLTIALGAFIMSAAYLLFSSQHYAYQTQQTVTQWQEIGRIASMILRDRLRQVGGLGCTSWQSALPFYNQLTAMPSDLPQNAQEIIRGHHGLQENWTPELPVYLKERVKNNTDVIIVHHAYEQSANLQQNMSTAQSSLQVEGELDLQIGDHVMVADCHQADLIEITHLYQQNKLLHIEHQPPANISNQLSKPYTKTAQISVLQSAAYYVGETGRYYENKKPIYALYQYMAQNNSQHQELIEGVSGLRVWYGIDTNRDNAVDKISELPPHVGEGELHSILLEIDTQSPTDDEQTWYVTTTIRN